MHGVLAWAGGVSTATGSASASASGRCCEVIHVSFSHIGRYLMLMFGCRCK